MVYKILALEGVQYMFCACMWLVKVSQYMLINSKVQLLRKLESIAVW